MYIKLVTLDGQELHTAREIYDAGKNNIFVETVVDDSAWVYFKEKDPKSITKHESQLRISVTWENTDRLAGNEFGQSISVGMYMDAHSEVDSTGYKYYTSVTEVFYTEMEVTYNRKMLFGVATKHFDRVKRHWSKGYCSLFRKEWLSLYELNHIRASLFRDKGEAIRVGAKLTTKVYTPAMK